MKKCERKIEVNINSEFYKNCFNNRRNKYKSCDTCPFRNLIEELEEETIGSEYNDRNYFV